MGAAINLGAAFFNVALWAATGVTFCLAMAVFSLAAAVVFAIMEAS